MTQFCVLITCSDGSDQIHGANCGPPLLFSDKSGLDIYPRGYIPKCGHCEVGDERCRKQWNGEWRLVLRGRRIGG